MNNFNSKKFKKFITPENAIDLLEKIENTNYFDGTLLYRIKNGHFSIDNPEKSTGIFYVDIENKKIAGMIFVYREKEILADLETDKEYRNNGIGTQLVIDAIKLGAKYLAVNIDNEIAINIYKKCGFIEYYIDKKEKLSYMSLSGKPHKEDEKIINEKR